MLEAALAAYQHIAAAAVLRTVTASVTASSGAPKAGQRSEDVSAVSQSFPVTASPELSDHSGQSCLHWSCAHATALTAPSRVQERILNAAASSLVVLEQHWTASAWQDALNALTQRICFVLFACCVVFSKITLAGFVASENISTCRKQAPSWVC